METVIESDGAENTATEEPKQQLSSTVTSARTKIRQRLDVRFRALHSARQLTRQRLDRAISRIGEYAPRVLDAARDTLEKADRATETRLVHVEARVASWLGAGAPPPDAAVTDS
jgi:hypothetical protein